MGINENVYSMRRLTLCHELDDAQAAQHRAGGERAYFTLLAEFVQKVPQAFDLLSSLKLPSDITIYLNALDELQFDLSAIGAIVLGQEITKVYKLALDKQYYNCKQRVLFLSVRIHELCVCIEAAKHVLPHAPREEGGEPQAAGDAGALSENPLPKCLLTAKILEQLGAFINAFEIEKAKTMLGELMQFSYGVDIDEKLNRIFNSISGFLYDEAMEEVGALFNSIEEGNKDNTSPKKKILAIDDIPDVLHTIDAVLRDTYTVYGVTNYMLALKFLASNTVDLILLDIEMPDMNGFALLEILRKIEPCKEIPILFITGSATEQNVRKSVLAGGNDLIRKPIDAKILLKRVKRHLLPHSASVLGVVGRAKRFPNSASAK